MFYFAYGSNMQWERIKERCPSAAFVCAAKLPGYRLIFARYSQDNGCWTAGIEQSSGDEVWGVVYEILEREMEDLGVEPQ